MQKANIITKTILFTGKKPEHIYDVNKYYIVSVGGFNPYIQINKETNEVSTFDPFNVSPSILRNIIERGEI